nr:MAG TPA: hypothetical protein [Inoviridae sp.]
MSLLVLNDSQVSVLTLYDTTYTIVSMSLSQQY